MKKYIFLIILIFLTTSCTYKEINDLAIANAIGIDYENKEYTITLQIMDLNSGNNEEENQATRTSLMYVGTGKTIPSAIRNITLKYPNTIYLGHLELMVIGQGVIENDIEETFDYFMRSPEARTEALLVVSNDNKAKNILNTNDEKSESFPAKDIITTIENSNQRNGKITEIVMEDFVATNKEKGIDPIVPTIVTSKNPNKDYKNTKLIGMSIFKNNKLQEVLEDEPIIAYNLINNNFSDIIVNTTYENENIATVLINPKNSIKINIKNNKPEININIKTDSYLVDVNKKLKLITDQELTKIQENLNQTIKEYIISLINYSKKTNTDILGIKNKIYKHYPKKYNQYKNKNIYEISNININTKTKLFRYGNSNTSNYGGNNE